MKWINAEQQVTVTLYDEEHEEHFDKIMTVEEMLDTYTNEGCPTMYSDREVKRGRWIERTDGSAFCSECGTEWLSDSVKYYKFCPICGAKMEAEE